MTNIGVKSICLVISMLSEKQVRSEREESVQRIKQMINKVCNEEKRGERERRERQRVKG